MKCPACQAENREGARFCLRCGTSLSAPWSAFEAVAVGQPATLTEKATPPAPPPALTEEQPVSGIPGAQQAADGVMPVTQAEPHATPSEGIPQPAAAQGAETAKPTEQTSPKPTVAERAAELVAATAPPAQDRLGGLEPGTMVGDRFEIVELLESNPDSNLYSANDLALCPACHQERDRSDNQYCTQCGIALESAGPPVVRRVQEASSPEAIHASAEQGFFSNARFYLPLPGEALIAIPQVEQVSPHGANLTVGCASDVGMRELDEDSLGVFVLSGVYQSLVDPTLGLFILADGMGGYEGGEVASKLTVQVIADRLLRNVLLRRFTEEDQPVGEAVRVHVVDAVREANQRVYALAQERGNDMGCTLTMALLMDGQVYVANIGDSRTYIFGAGGLRQITTDHSLIARLVAAGVAKAEEVYTHPQRHVLYRALGSEPNVEVDVYEEQLAPGQTFVLCCDGLWESIHSEGIEDVLLTEHDPQATCDELVHRANQAGGEDNISAIVAKLAPALPRGKAASLSQEKHDVADCSQKGVTALDGNDCSKSLTNE